MVVVSHFPNGSSVITRHSGLIVDTTSTRYVVPFRAVTSMRVERWANDTQTVSVNTIDGKGYSFRIDNDVAEEMILAYEDFEGFNDSEIAKEMEWLDPEDEIEWLDPELDG